MLIYCMTCLTVTQLVTLILKLQNKEHDSKYMKHLYRKPKIELEEIYNKAFMDNLKRRRINDPITKSNKGA